MNRLEQVTYDGVRFVLESKHTLHKAYVSS